MLGFLHHLLHPHNLPRLLLTQLLPSQSLPRPVPLLDPIPATGPLLHLVQLLLGLLFFAEVGSVQFLVEVLEEVGDLPRQDIIPTSVLLKNLLSIIIQFGIFLLEIEMINAVDLRLNLIKLIRNIYVDCFGGPRDRWCQFTLVDKLLAQRLLFLLAFEFLFYILLLLPPPLLNTLLLLPHLLHKFTPLLILLQPLLLMLPPDLLDRDAPLASSEKILLGFAEGALGLVCVLGGAGATALDATLPSPQRHAILCIDFICELRHCMAELR